MVVVSAPAMSKGSRYTVLRKIADGGMAEIYLGTQHGAAGFERPIVIKRIRSAFSEDGTFRNMLIDEAHIAMGLIHSNVAQVLDLGAAQGHCFLVLELVDGWDVDTLVRRARAAGRTFPPSLALYVTAEVCRALAFAHARSVNGQSLHIVHRDVSPENILVSEQGEVKLADFGIATAINKRDRTSVGVVKGKLGFMSPEQANGLSLDGRSDLHALGASLYVAALGSLPVQGRTELEVLLRQQQGDFIAPRTVQPDVAPELEALILRAMEKEPAARFQSADEMLLEVERVQRTVFGPAGQTELKAWLADLAQADGAQPTSRRPPPLKKAERESGEQEMAEGTALILTDVAPPRSDTQPMLVPPSGMEEAPVTVVTEQLPARRGGGILGVALLGALAGGGWWFTRETPLPTQPVAVVADAALPSVAVTEAAEPDAGAAPELAFEPEALEESPTPPRERADTPDGNVQSSTVSVKFASTPPGAQVVVNGKSFGVTPLSIRFKPGLTHDVTLKKDGFQDAQRRVYVSRGKNQVVQVGMEKTAAPGPKKKKWWPF
jgi:serine/threonine-protein kinase